MFNLNLFFGVDNISPVYIEGSPGLCFRAPYGDALLAKESQPVSRSFRGALNL